MSVCILKALLIAVIVPLIHTGCKGTLPNAIQSQQNPQSTLYAKMHSEVFIIKVPVQNYRLYLSLTLEMDLKASVNRRNNTLCLFTYGQVSIVLRLVTHVDLS